MTPDPKTIPRWMFLAVAALLMGLAVLFNAAWRVHRLHEQPIKDLKLLRQATEIRVGFQGTSVVDPPGIRTLLSQVVHADRRVVPTTKGAIALQIFLHFGDESECCFLVLEDPPARVLGEDGYYRLNANELADLKAMCAKAASE